MTEHYPMLLAQQVQPSGVPEVRAPYDGKVLGSVDLGLGVGGIPYTFHEIQMAKMLVGSTGA